MKVGDFGLSISTLARDETHLTLAGTILGTPAFASPEQMRGDALDVRADIYSVGATLYYLLTGRAPFEEANVVKLVGQVLSSAPGSPRTISPAVPKGLAAVVLRCLGKSSADRPQTYAALRQALLPFASLASTPATLGLRILANFVDSLVLATLGLSTLIRITKALGGAGSPGTGGLSSLEAWDPVAGVALAIAYYGLLEGLWGRSLGKALFGLRVLDAGRQVPGLRRALARTCIFEAAASGLQLTLVFALGGPVAYAAANARPGATPWPVLAALLLDIVGIAILFSTARRSNGFAGLHDFLSNTRVVAKTAVAATPSSRSADTAVAARLSTRVFGPYVAVEQTTGPRAGTVVAFDPRLRRSVWIQPQPVGSSALSAARQNLARKARLRWLTGHRTPGDSWDAFEAVEGRPFASAIESPQSWRVVREWLRDLASEAESAEKDGTLPALAADAVWVGADGRVRLLDFGDSTGDADAAMLQDFLLVVAGSALAGRVAASAEEGRGLPTGPIPLSAGRLLHGLAASRVGSAQEVSAIVAGSAAGPAEITRSHRGRNLALGFLVPVLLLLPTAISVVTDWQRAEAKAWLTVLARGDRAGGDGLSPQAREAVSTFAASLLPPDTSQFEARYQPVIERLRRAHPGVTAEEQRRAEAALAALGVRPSVVAADEKRKTVFAAVSVPFFLWSCLALVSTISATIARGGMILGLFGIAVVREDGARASRFRCFLRAVVAWLPVIAATAGRVRVSVLRPEVEARRRRQPVGRPGPTRRRVSRNRCPRRSLCRRSRSRGPASPARLAGPDRGDLARAEIAADIARWNREHGRS